MFGAPPLPLIPALTPSPPLPPSSPSTPATLTLYSQRVSRFLRDLRSHVTAHHQRYRASMERRAVPAAPSHRPLVVGDLVLLLRPRARKLLIPNSGPYLLTALHAHTATLRNLATGAQFHENLANLKLMQLPH